MTFELFYDLPRTPETAVLTLHSIVGVTRTVYKLCYLRFQTLGFMFHSVSICQSFPAKISQHCKLCSQWCSEVVIDTK